MLRRLLVSMLLMVSMIGVSGVLVSTPVQAAGKCEASSAFDIFPRWYKYVEDRLDSNCNFTDFAWGDVWKIALAVLEILLRLAGVVAFVFVVMGGFKFVLSKGNPQDAAKARQTLLDAIIGLTIAMIATVMVNFIGRTLSK